MEPKRIRHACSRCRRQKLRCDDERPCPLCVRAGAECIEATQRTWRSNRPRSAAYQARQRRLEEQRNSISQVQADVQQDCMSQLQHEREIVVNAHHVSGVSPETQSAKSSPVGNIDPEDAAPPDQRASALHLVGKIFQKFHANGSGQNHKIDAIPASDSPEDGLDPTQSEMVPVVDLIGITLPPLSVVNALLDSYRDMIHWYIRVHHEPSFRARLKPIVESGFASRQQQPLLLLALMIMVIGSRFLHDKVRERIASEISLTELTSKMVVICERWFLPLMDCVNVDTVIYAYLLAAHYMWTRQTRAAFLTLGTTVRAAQSIGLNREAQWGNISDTERETRRCAWWSVFIGAGFISMSWGTPPMLSEGDCQVRQPTDAEDAYALEQCPGFGSLEKREDGELRPVTVGSYNRYKAEMYKIAITIMRQVYFTQHRKPEDLVQLTSGLHQRLLALEKSIPQELRVENHPIIDSEEDSDVSTRKIFAIQAVTLRVSCDNMYIFLFRPFISIGSVPRSLGGTRENSPGLAAHSNLGSVPSSFLNIAQQQCWTSAMRTSEAALRPDIMQLFLFTFAAVHTGVHSFSAGVMLGVLALLSPLSPRGQESKRGIARIIQIPKVAKLKTDIWSQMTGILTDLMHVIATEETKALIANPTGVDFTETLAKPEAFGEPSNPYGNLDTYQRSENRGARVPVSVSRDAGINESEASESSTSQGNHDTNAGEMNICSAGPASQYSGHLMAGAMNHQSQYNPQFDMFDAPDFWLPPQPGWPADPLQTMDQLWMWDGSIPYN